MIDKKNNMALLLSKQEVKIKIAKAVKEVKNDTAVLLTQKEYEKDMQEFLNKLQFYLKML